MSLIAACATGVALATSPSAASPRSAADCLAPPYSEAETPAQTRLVEVARNMRETLQGVRPLLDTLDTVGPTICLSGALVVEKAYFDPAANAIHLAADMPDGLMLAVLIHELRHVEQTARGICPTDTLAMRSYARATLALEADANVVMHLVAWQRREEGDRRLWEALEDWPMTTDIATRFADVMAETASVSEAAAAAFDQWYASDFRRELYYVATCSEYLDRQDAAHAVPDNRLLATDFFSTLCVLPGGAEYACADSNMP